MAKWINGSTTEIETFGTGKRGNKCNESNQNIRIFTKKKDVLPFPISVGQDIPQRGKYRLKKLATYGYHYLLKNFNNASVKSSVGLLLPLSQH